MATIDEQDVSLEYLRVVEASDGEAESPLPLAGGGLASLADAAAMRGLDLVISTTLLLLLLPLILIVAVAIKVESRGPVFYRCRRVGCSGAELAMLKFRKMRGDAAGPALTASDDERFTRLGRFLATSKLDEIPQLWNVLRGQMSLVGPRPEDPTFVALHAREYEELLGVRPGITGLCQLAFARESDILDPTDRVGDYARRLLPRKIELDRLYVAQRSLRTNVRILAWTAVAVLLRRDVAVHRSTGRLTVRRPTSPRPFSRDRRPGSAGAWSRR